MVRVSSIEWVIVAVVTTEARIAAHKVNCYLSLVVVPCIVVERVVLSF